MNDIDVIRELEKEKNKRGNRNSHVLEERLIEKKIFYYIHDELLLDSIEINNYFCIENIEIENIGDKKEIYFLGENGMGKTILLQSILMCLRGDVKETVLYDYLIKNQDFNKENNLEINAKGVGDLLFNFNFPEPKEHLIYPNIFAYGVNRNIFGAQLTDKQGFITLFDNDVYLMNPSDWLKDLQRRNFVYKDKLEKNNSKERLIKPIELNKAIELLKALINIDEGDKTIDIEVDNDVVFTERGTKLQFEQLSDGYKSVLVWGADLLSRLAESQPYVTDIQDFVGIVLVDEIDLFLHPRWAMKLVGRLRKLFPKIQWIFTTHSPIVTLSASKDAVFYKLYKEKGKTKLSGPINGLSGNTANSLITSPLWGLDDFVTAGTSLNEISSDDYVYQIIHASVRERIKNTINFNREEVEKMVNKLLNKLQTLDQQMTHDLPTDVAAANKMLIE